MKAILSSFVMLMMTTQAHAVHFYASYSCTAKNGIKLIYNGPGSNYAVGGYSNFYAPKSEDRILAYENFDEKGRSTVGEDVGDSGALQITFEFTKVRQVGKPVVTPVDVTDCEGFDYEHTDSRSVRKVKITGISDAAAKTLKLKANDVLVMSCEDTSDVPVKCDKD